ncbi:MAG: imidazole glycerol phosphate synthase subunit HisH, partial [Beijerinckiaceae bacterium]
MKVALIDYGAGNLHSCAKALERAMAEAGIAGSVAVTGFAADVAVADRIVLPGDGAYADCMTALTEAPDMIATLEQRVRRDGVPFLGICVG